MPANMSSGNIGKDYTVTTADNGRILFLGDASSSRTSAKTIMWVPNIPFTGAGFTVVARVYGPAPDKAGITPVPVPYRRVYLNGVASDRAIVSDTLPATAWLIEVPANGQVIALVISCTVGTGQLYNWDSVGSAT